MSAATGYQLSVEDVRVSPVPLVLVADGLLLAASQGLADLLRIDESIVTSAIPATVVVQFGAADPTATPTPVVLTRGDRLAVTLRPSIVPLDPEGRARLVALHDITDEHERFADLAYRSAHDEHSRLQNRLTVIDRIGRWLDDGFAVRVVAVGLPQFDTLVSLLGDQYAGILMGVAAKRIEAAVWSEDVIARAGSARLIVASPALVGDVEDALDLAVQVVDVVGSSVELGAASFPTSSVCGVHVAVPGDIADVVVHGAELAMRTAIARGVEALAFDSSMRDAERRLLVVERALQEAIAGEELELYLQPIVDPVDRRVLSYEALCRWFHPTLGQISPGEFIPLAERDGLIRSIGEWTLAEALRILQRWRALDPNCPPIAINLSAAQLLDASFTELMLESVRAHDATGLVIAEVTESVLVSADANRLLGDLAAGGIPLAIDDFGTGFSALSYLAQLPASTLKIDQSFVARLEEPRSRILVGTAIAMGHGLGMRVVAEGVETGEQLAILRSLGCDAIQGYFTGRPQPAASIDVPASPPTPAGARGPS
jgi:EAL domain-containing protein (putative c-di-GMP-specific phosphodiesterase class I)/GGDEF domain-containing protein